MSDLSRQEVSTFLDKNQIQKSVHERAFSLTGGRILHLKIMVPILKDDKRPFEGIVFIIEDAQDALLQKLGCNLFNHWEKIDVLHRPTCKKILEFALTHEHFTKIDLAKKVFHGHDPECIGNALKSLFQANLISDLGGGNYKVHSNAEREYLSANIGKLL